MKAAPLLRWRALIEWLATKALSGLKDRLLLVDDAIAALQTLAHRVYENVGQTGIGITGSAGKTTAKELDRASSE